MSTHAELAAKLLRDAAEFFRNVGEQNGPIEDQMQENANVYERVAELLEVDPQGEFRGAWADDQDAPGNRGG